MTRGADGLWTVTIPSQVEGFHYYSIVVDGAVMADPATRTFFGSGWDNSGIEIPPRDADFYAPKDVPHGDVRERWYFSKVTGKWRRCYVYTPPDYDANANTRYPVLYLLHGWGENEQGWPTQGHVDFIMDNLIAAKKANPMIIVMDNLNAVKPGEDAGLYWARSIIARRSMADVPGGLGARGASRPGFPPNWGETFTEMMFTDLIPIIERTYRVLPGRDNRAMAGLSMGGAQTFKTALNNLDKFAYLGGFSGSCAGRDATFRPEDQLRRSVRRPGSIQQEGEGSIPRHRICRRPRDEELQRHAYKRGHPQRLLRVPRHGTRMAHLASVPERFCNSPFQVGTRLIAPIAQVSAPR